MAAQLKHVVIFSNPTSLQKDKLIEYIKQAVSNLYSVKMRKEKDKPSSGWGVIIEG